MSDLDTTDLTFDERLDLNILAIKAAATNLRYLLATEIHNTGDTMWRNVKDMSMSDLVKLASDIQCHRALASNRSGK